MTEVKTEVKSLLDAGWEVYTADEVRLEHEAETRRMWLPKGQRTKLSVDRKKTSQSFFGALSLTSKKSNCIRSRGTGTPSRQSARWNDSNAKPRQRRSRSSWTTPDSTTRSERVDHPLRAGSTAGAHHPCFPAAVHARSKPSRARLERGQEQHREHSARDPRRNLRRVRLPRHRPCLRPPPIPRNRKRIRFMTAMLPMISTQQWNLQGRSARIARSPCEEPEQSSVEPLPCPVARWLLRRVHL